MKKKTILVGGIAVLCIAAILAYLYGTRGQYLIAEQRCEQSPAFAVKTLERVPDDYRDAADLKQYATALMLAEQEQYAGAISLLKELGDYRNAVAHWEEITYDYAVSLRDKGKFDEAVAQFEASFFEDYKTQVTQTKYEKAASLARNGDYAAAAELFESLGDYADSPTRRLDCLAEDAVRITRDGDTQKAAEIMDTVTSASDAYKAQATEVYLAAARTLMEEENWTEALARLDRCESTDDVTATRETCVSMLTYHEAVARKEAGDYTGAIELLDTIPGFLDADTLNRACEDKAYQWKFKGFLSKDGTEKTKTKTFVRADTIYIYGTLSGGKPGRHIDLRFSWVDAYGRTTDALVEDWSNGTSGGVTFSYSVPKNANTGKSTIYIYNEANGAQIAKFTFTVKK